MYIKGLYGLLLSLALWLPLAAQAADHGNWDDGWAYFENNLEPDPPAPTPAPSKPCAFGVVHGESSCDCVQSTPIDYEFEGECMNPFGNDDAFLAAFKTALDSSGKYESLFPPIALFGVTITCACPNNCDHDPCSASGGNHKLCQCEECDVANCQNSCTESCASCSVTDCDNSCDKACLICTATDCPRNGTCIKGCTNCPLDSCPNPCAFMCPKCAYCLPSSSSLYFSPLTSMIRNDVPGQMQLHTIPGIIELLLYHHTYVPCIGHCGQCVYHIDTLAFHTASLVLCWNCSDCSFVDGYAEKHVLFVGCGIPGHNKCYLPNDIATQHEAPECNDHYCKKECVPCEYEDCTNTCKTICEPECDEHACQRECVICGYGTCRSTCGLICDHDVDEDMNCLECGELYDFCDCGRCDFCLRLSVNCVCVYCNLCDNAPCIVQECTKCMKKHECECELCERCATIACYCNIINCIKCLLLLTECDCAPCPGCGYANTPLACKCMCSNGWHTRALCTCDCAKCGKRVAADCTCPVCEDCGWRTSSCICPRDVHCGKLLRHCECGPNIDVF